MSENFFIEKERNKPIEQTVAPLKIQEWYARQGKRILRILPNTAEDNSKEQAAWDFVDTFGLHWEEKQDWLSYRTGRIYLEHRAVNESAADYFLFLAPRYAGGDYLNPNFWAGFVLSKPSVLAIIQSGLYPVRQGGDFGKSWGTTIPKLELSKQADVI